MMQTETVFFPLENCLTVQCLRLFVDNDFTPFLAENKYEELGIRQGGRGTRYNIITALD